MAIIYALTDPRNGEMKYIGQTNNHIARFKQHLALSDGNWEKRKWIIRLKAANLEPSIIILEKQVPDAIRLRREAYWIRYYLNRGANLTNHVTGTHAHLNALLEEQRKLGDEDSSLLLEIAEETRWLSQWKYGIGLEEPYFEPGFIHTPQEMVSTAMAKGWVLYCQSVKLSYECDESAHDGRLEKVLRKYEEAIIAHIVHDCCQTCGVYMHCVKDGFYDRLGRFSCGDECRKKQVTIQRQIPQENQPQNIDTSDETNGYEDVAIKWKRLLVTAILSGRAHFASSTGDNYAPLYGWVKSLRPYYVHGEKYEEEIWSSKGICIGWFDDNDVFLDPIAAYKVVREQGSSQNEDIFIPEITIRKKLAQSGLLASTELQSARKTLTIRRRFRGERRDVLHIKKDMLV